MAFSCNRDIYIHTYIHIYIYIYIHVCILIHCAVQKIIQHCKAAYSRNTKEPTKKTKTSVSSSHSHSTLAYVGEKSSRDIGDVYLGAWSGVSRGTRPSDSPGRVTLSQAPAPQQAPRPTPFQVAPWVSRFLV